MKDREVLYRYRMNQAEETLAGAKKMLEEKLTPRSIVNRSYYSMFTSCVSKWPETARAVRQSFHRKIFVIAFLLLTT